MLRRKWGRIINVSKSADTMHDRAASPYGTSKAALEAMTASWAEDLAGTGVTVNSLAPGGQTDTAFGTPAGRESARAAGRLLAPDVMDGVAVWLASDASSAESGSRFIGRLWDADLPVAQAVERAREPSIVRVPARRSKG
jgi:3-oxoacyl-[acyl-carrier protein] reductase